MDNVVGVVGLGQMGGAMAGHLVAAGFRIVGYDPDEGARQRLAAAGGTAVASVGAVAEAATTVLTSLPSAAALDEVVQGQGGLLSAGRPVTLVETSTLPLDVKEANRRAVEDFGGVALDCPLSGTGAQARTRDIVVLASGDAEALDRCVPLFEAVARAHHLLGPFGNGSRMKYLANLLVTIHNAAAAEALVLASKAGIDRQLALDVLCSGAGTSRMLEVRGPAMVAGDYDTAGIRADVYLKDVQIITDFARGIGCPVPLFATSAQLHVAAVAQGHGAEDTASVAAVLERMAGLDPQRAER